MKFFSKNEDFIFEIIHDLKSPVLSMDFALKTIKRNEFLEEIYRINKHNLNYIEDLLSGYLTLRGKYRLRCENIDLYEIVAEEIKVLSFLIKKKNLKIELKVEKNSNTKITTDKALARQIILNLLSNAVKYTQENEKITIRLLNKDGFLRICFKNPLGCDFSLENSTKMGLGIVSKKIKLLFGTFEINKFKDEICFTAGFKCP